MPDDADADDHDGGHDRDARQVLNRRGLTQSGVVRQDIRRSFSGQTPVADGVQVYLEISLTDGSAACNPLADHAIYVWHADPGGHCSIYDLPDANCLRGVAVTDAAGKARFTTVLPGCYVGRWPHIHFEVFTGLHAAVSGDNSLVIAQFVVPGAVAKAVYADDPRYAGSIGNLANVALGAGFVFSDNTPEQITAQTLVMTGSANAGYQAGATVGIASAGLLRKVRDM